MGKNNAVQQVNSSRKKNWFHNVFLRFIPRKKDKTIWIFSSYLGRYQDNAKYLFEYASKHIEGVECIYFVNDQVDQDQLSKNGLKSVLIDSKEARRVAKKAGVSFYTHGIDDFGDYIYNYNSYVVALWHGVGFKEMYYADRNFKDNIVKKIYRGLFSYVHRDLSIATSKYAFDCYAKDFLLKKNSQYEIIGQPRNDVFFEKKETNKKNYKMLLYAPTYRRLDQDNAVIKSFIDYFSSVEGQKFLKDKGFKLFVRLHPITDSIDIPESDVVINACELNGQQLLLDTDVLITDYSSIATDFAISKKQVIIYAPDFTRYTSVEPMFVGSERIYEHPDVCHNIEDIVNQINQGNLNITNEFNNLLNTDLEGNYCFKICSAIINRLNLNKKASLK